MFKKITALLLVTAFTNLYAITPVRQSAELADQLNKTFDSLNYKLNVEWDQKDSKVFDSTIAEFEKEISALQKEGVSNEDLVKYTSDKIKDKEIQNDRREMSTVIAGLKMTNEEARNYIISKLGSTYSHGASWSGSRMGGHTAVIIAAIIIILIVVHNAHKDDGTVEPTPTPTPTPTETPCDNSGWDYGNKGKDWNPCEKSFQGGECCPA